MEETPLLLLPCTRCMEEEEGTECILCVTNVTCSRCAGGALDDGDGDTYYCNECAQMSHIMMSPPNRGECMVCRRIEKDKQRQQKCGCGGCDTYVCVLCGDNRGWWRSDQVFDGSCERCNQPLCETNGTTIGEQPCNITGLRLWYCIRGCGRYTSMNREEGDGEREICIT